MKLLQELMEMAMDDKKKVQDFLTHSTLMALMLNPQTWQSVFRNDVRGRPEYKDFCEKKLVPQMAKMLGCKPDEVAFIDPEKGNKKEGDHLWHFLNDHTQDEDDVIELELDIPDVDGDEDEDANGSFELTKHMVPFRNGLVPIVRMVAVNEDGPDDAEFFVRVGTPLILEPADKKLIRAYIVTKGLKLNTSKAHLIALANKYGVKVRLGDPKKFIWEETDTIVAMGQRAKVQTFFNELCGRDVASPNDDKGWDNDQKTYAAWHENKGSYPGEVFLN